MSSNLAYQEEPWEELIDGGVVAASPRPMYNHNHTAFNIALMFKSHLKGKRSTAAADGTGLCLFDDLEIALEDIFSGLLP